MKKKLWCLVIGLMFNFGMVQAKIEVIVFDIGDVFVESNTAASLAAIEKHTSEKLNDDLINQLTTLIGIDFSTGIIKTEQFLSQLRTLLKLPDPISNDELIRIFNASLGPVHKGNLAYLKDLKNRGYRLFALTDTNAIHFPHVCYLVKEAGYSLNDLFEKIIKSYETSSIKKNPDSFQAIISQFDLDPEKTLFVDDDPKNLEVAASLMLKTKQYTIKSRVDLNLDQLLQ